MSARRRVIKVPDYRVDPPRSLHVRTPEEQAAVKAALDSGYAWSAWGPIAGTCGHAHLTPQSAARCLEPARPKFARRTIGNPGGGFPPVRYVAPPRRRTWGDLLEAAAPLAVLVFFIWSAL